MNGKGNDFFRPLWLRVAIVLACVGWAVVEWMHDQAGWALIAAAVAAYGAWSFLIDYKADGDKKG